jgi:hypothetical protein
LRNPGVDNQLCFALKALSQAKVTVIQCLGPRLMRTISHTPKEKKGENKKKSFSLSFMDSPVAVKSDVGPK